MAKNKKSVTKKSFQSATSLASVAQEYALESRKDKFSAFLWIVATFYCFIFAAIYNFSLLGADLGFSIFIGVVEYGPPSDNIEFLKFAPMNLLFLTAIGLCSRFVAFYIKTSKERKTASLELLAFDSAQQQLDKNRQGEIITNYFLNKRRHKP